MSRDSAGQPSGFFRGVLGGSPTRRFSYRVCGACGAPSESKDGNCPACGADIMLGVENGYILTFPKGTLGCVSCGSDSEPVSFRGWSRLASLFIWVRDQRMAGYVCRACAQKEAAKSLLFTALLGWLSVPSWFFYGWRSTYLNWRSVWASPSSPHEWGAMSAAEFSEAVREAREQIYEDIDSDIFAASPLADLDEDQLGLVLSADGLYELLGVEPTASEAEIRRAYRRRSKEAHPDLSADNAASPDEMILLNQAWAVLRDPVLRDAYDWSEENLEKAA